MKAQCALLCLLLVSLCHASDVEGSWNEFLRKYSKKYASNEERDMRFTIFKKNLEMAAVHQAQNPKATFGVTKFMDLTPEEFKSTYLRPSHPPTTHTITAEEAEAMVQPRSPTYRPDPVNWDWSRADAVTPPYDQGQCGAPSVFAAVETVESYWALATHDLQELSVQQIIDCAPGAGGCSGGLLANVYAYITQYGLETADDYPFNESPGTCQYNDSLVFARIRGTVGMSGGENGLYKQLSSPTGGPVTVSVNAASWQSYQGGVLTQCDQGTPDHDAVVTGYANYGSSNAYWNVRNDWGAEWGEGGYVWIAIGQDLCGIGDNGLWPLI